MHLPTNASGRFFVRLRLESLESRTLLSSTPLLSAAGALQTTSSQPANEIAINYLHVASTTATKQAAKTVDYSYHWGVIPGLELVGTNSKTSNKWSTGGVTFSMVRDSTSTTTIGKGGSLPVGFVETFSTAKKDAPDKYNSSFVITLKLKDGSHSEVLSFTATITGTLTKKKSTLKITFQNPTQKVTIGKDVFTVTLPATITPSSPTGLPKPIIAHIKVSAAPTSTAG